LISVVVVVVAADCKETVHSHSQLLQLLAAALTSCRFTTSSSSIKQ
jgi:hypothetical protein